MTSCRSNFSWMVSKDLTQILTRYPPTHHAIVCFNILLLLLSILSVIELPICILRLYEIKNQKSKKGSNTVLEKWYCSLWLLSCSVFWCIGTGITFKMMLIIFIFHEWFQRTWHKYWQDILLYLLKFNSDFDASKWNIHFDASESELNFNRYLAIFCILIHWI